MFGVSEAGSIRVEGRCGRRVCPGKVMVRGVGGLKGPCHGGDGWERNRWAGHPRAVDKLSGWGEVRVSWGGWEGMSLRGRVGRGGSGGGATKFVRDEDECQRCCVSLRGWWRVDAMQGLGAYERDAMIRKGEEKA